MMAPANWLAICRPVAGSVSGGLVMRSRQAGRPLVAVPPSRSGRVPNADSGVGCHQGALWLSAHPCPAAAGRAANQLQTYPANLPGVGPSTSQQDAGTESESEAARGSGQATASNEC